VGGPDNGPIGNLPGAALDLSNIAPTAAVDFNGQVITNVGTPVNPSDVVTKGFFDSNPPAGAANIPLDNILPVASVDFNSQKLVNVADPTNPQDVVTLSYFGSNVAGGATRQLDNLLNTAVNANIFYATGNIGSTIWTIGTPDNPGFSAASLHLTTGTSTVGFQSNIDIRTGAVAIGSNIQSGDIILATGNNTQAGSTGVTGDVNISTGTKTTSTGLTGSIIMRTGSTSNGGNFDDSGPILIETGNASGLGDTGNVTLRSGVGQTSGAVLIESGQSGGVGTVSGAVTLRSGQANINTGNLILDTGNSTTSFSGSAFLRTGNAGTNSGPITIQTGTAGTTRGDITLNGNRVRMDSSDDAMIVPTLAADPTALINGMVWYNTTDSKMRIYANNLTVDLN
jgi:hypothetical protein